jgi:uncharacterized protein (DUF58 family)
MEGQAADRRQMPVGRLQTTLSLIVGLLLFLSFVPMAQAQDINFEASVDRTEVSIDEQITLTVSVSGNVKSIPEPELPPLNDFSVYSAGRSHNFSYTNGQLSSSVTFNYILAPRKAGKFTIGPAKITVDGKTFQTTPIEITVTAGAETETAPPATGEQKKAQKPPQLAGKDLFIRTFVDKKQAYVNDQITLTFQFFQGVRLFNNPEYTPPSLTGFWSEDLPPKRQFYKTVDGRQYFVQELKMALFPTSTGKLTIGSAELKCTVEDLDRFLNRDPFAMFDRDLLSLFRQGKPQILKSQAIEVEVLPLPEIDKPADFSGTVGDFKLKVSLDKSEVEVGQPITLTARISGVGNIKSVSEPVIAELPDFRTYSSGSSENVSKDNYTVQGVKTYEEVLIPRKAGKYTLPPVRFSFFDPKDKTYRQLESQPFLLSVTPSAEAYPAEIAQLSKQEIGTAAKDIRYIKVYSGNFGDQGRHLYNKPVFLILQLIPLLAFALSWRYQSVREKLDSDVGYARERRARGFAQKRLKLARKLISAQNSKEFYCEISRAMLQYVGDKLNLSAHGLTKDSMVDSLTQKGFAKERIDDLVGLLDSCDFARFAPGSSTEEEMRRFLDRAEKAIVELEE